MRRLILVSTLLLLAACNDRGQWENEQAELANEASPPAAQANDVTAAAPAANDVNAVAGNDVNAATTDMNDVNSAAPANEAAPKG
jgi:hypothetical protein